MSDVEASYTVLPEKIKVSRDKFEEFINSYPRELKKNEADYEGRHYVWYDDLLLDENEPHNTVASISYPLEPPVTEGLTKCYVLINYKKCFDSKI